MKNEFIMEYMYLQTLLDKSVITITLLNSLFSWYWVILYIFHGEKISLSSKEDLGHSRYFSPLKNTG